MNVVFFAETAEGKITEGGWELLSWSLSLTAPEKITALIISQKVDPAEPERLARSGAGNVTVWEDVRLDPADIATYATLLKSYCEKTRPDVLLGSATLLGRTLFPYTAMLLKTGLTADCTSLTVESETGLLLQTRPAIGGNVMAVIKTPGHKPQMATVRPHSAPQIPPQHVTPGRIVRLPFSETLSPGMVQTFSRRRLETSEGLAEAKRIVSVGKGIKREANIELARRLAERLGAALGASREVVDRGWLPHSAQVGLSGKTVVPDLYVALGISGTVQHLAGMQTAKKIIAVNSDPDAPIFQTADLGIVGDLFEVVPRWIERLDETRGK
ncbi:MAG: electron transfer flavoprotein subunit alpha/FixB family protein [Thermoguttaceae bacterium]|jgi:electron transfer flavoprotein alpha subunit